ADVTLGCVFLNCHIHRIFEVAYHALSVGSAKPLWGPKLVRSWLYLGRDEAKRNMQGNHDSFEKKLKSGESLRPLIISENWVSNIKSDDAQSCHTRT
ncbi:uncharacterized protein Bfra_001374, partial [Botrytis fragariae]